MTAKKLISPIAGEHARYLPLCSLSQQECRDGNPRITKRLIHQPDNRLHLPYICRLENYLMVLRVTVLRHGSGIRRLIKGFAETAIGIRGKIFFRDFMRQSSNAA